MPYWFTLVSSTVFYIIAWRMPKRLRPDEVYSTAVFAVWLNTFADMFLMYKLHLYGYFSNRITPVFTSFLWTLLFLLAVFPPVSTIFLNYYPYGRHWPAHVGYVLVWSLLAVGYEWLSLQTGVLQYRHWHLWYSAVLYPWILWIAAGNLALLRKLHQRP
ncbi:MAG: hypothetical protein K6T31_05320 [Alicyclobacillus sp.]|nr:hypothetical protein [Alicyclobacillus sp.]